jgi:hypothetical protein
MANEASAEAGDGGNYHPAYQTVKDLWHQFKVLWAAVQIAWDDSLMQSEGDDDRCPPLVETDDDWSLATTPSLVKRGSPLADAIDEPPMNESPVGHPVATRMSCHVIASSPPICCLFDAHYSWFVYCKMNRCSSTAYGSVYNITIRCNASSCTDNITRT